MPIRQRKGCFGMKKLIAILLAAVLSAALLCACREFAQEPTEFRNDYPGTYRYENNTIRERSSRVLTVNEDGTYTYVRVSTMEEKNGTFTGTWTIDREGYIVLKGDISGLTSRGSLSDDTLKLNIADVGHGEDTVGDGIYQYQYPEPNQATPDAG